MARDQAERVALTEAAFRIANERMSAWEETRTADEPATYFCECAVDGCREGVRLSRAEYEHIREDPRHFAVLHGHILPEFETEVERHDGYSMIEKPNALVPLLNETDPRGEPSGAANDEATELADDIKRDGDD
jgi:hypothetical protein